MQISECDRGVCATGAASQIKKNPLMGTKDERAAKTTKKRERNDDDIEHERQKKNPTAIEVIASEMQNLKRISNEKT